MSFLLNKKKMETAAGVLEEKGSSKVAQEKPQVQKRICAEQSSRQRGADLRSGKLVPFIQSRQEDLQQCITSVRRICLL